MPRIHILGASGSGTTTLGAALASRLDVPHWDADTIFWVPTEPPFTTRRPRAERMALLQQHLPAAGNWVFSGSAVGWATSLEPFYDLIVYTYLDRDLRMKRLRAREREAPAQSIEDVLDELQRTRDSFVNLLESLRAGGQNCRGDVYERRADSNCAQKRMFH